MLVTGTKSIDEGLFTEGKSNVDGLDALFIKEIERDDENKMFKLLNSVASSFMSTCCLMLFS